MICVCVSAFNSEKRKKIKNELLKDRENAPLKAYAWAMYVCAQVESINFHLFD